MSRVGAGAICLVVALVMSACAESETETSPTTSTPVVTGGDAATTDAPTSTGPSSSRDEPGQSGVGFDVLAVASGTVDLSVDDPPQQGSSLAASNPDELAALWRQVGLDRPVPSVDFGLQVVVAYLVGGSGSCREHLATFDVDHGARTATAVFDQTLPFEACTDDLNLRWHVAAVDIADLGEGPMTFKRATDGPGERATPARVDVPAPSGRPTPTTDPATSVTPGDVPAPLGEVALPEPGEAVSTRLDDGTPVWVVAHDGGDVTVVDAIAPTSSNTFMEPPAPVHMVVSWHPGAQRFGGPGAWDAWGRPLLGPDVRLQRRAAVVDGDRVLIDDPAAPHPGRPVRGVLDDGASTTVVEPHVGETISIGELLNRGTGKSVVAESLVIARTSDGRRIGRLCALADPSRGASQPCPDDAPLAFDVSVPARQSGELTTYFGPIFVEVSDGEIVRVALVSDGVASRLWDTNSPGSTVPHP